MKFINLFDQVSEVLSIPKKWLNGNVICDPHEFLHNSCLSNFQLADNRYMDQGEISNDHSTLKFYINVAENSIGILCYTPTDARYNERMFSIYFALSSNNEYELKYKHIAHCLNFNSVILVAIAYLSLYAKKKLTMPMSDDLLPLIQHQEKFNIHASLVGNLLTIY